MLLFLRSLWPQASPRQHLGSSLPFTPRGEQTCWDRSGMLQARLAGGGLALAAALHTAHVYNERHKAPVGRLRQFSPASQDQIVSDRLKTGDLVLFRRDCLLYTCAGAAVCAARQSFLQDAPSGAEPLPAFDQAGVIVMYKGEPHVLERTFSGTKLRRYDHRIQCARSPAILVRPLRFRLSADREKQLETWAVAISGGPEGSDTSTSKGREQDTKPSCSSEGDNGALSELVLRIPWDRSFNASVSLVSNAYEVAGLLPPTSSTSVGGGAVEAAIARHHVTMHDLAPLGSGKARMGSGSQSQGALTAARAENQGQPLSRGSVSSGRQHSTGGSPTGLEGPPQSPLDGAFGRSVWVRDLR